MQMSIGDSFLHSSPIALILGAVPIIFDELECKSLLDDFNALLMEGAFCVVDWYHLLSEGSLSKSNHVDQGTDSTGCRGRLFRESITFIILLSKTFSKTDFLLSPLEVTLMTINTVGRWHTFFDDARPAAFYRSDPWLSHFSWGIGDDRLLGIPANALSGISGWLQLLSLVRK
jgi:hypothetical protein